MIKLIICQSWTRWCYILSPELRLLPIQSCEIDNTVYGKEAIVSLEINVALSENFSDRTGSFRLQLQTLSTQMPVSDFTLYSSYLHPDLNRNYFLWNPWKGIKVESHNFAYYPFIFSDADNQNLFLLSYRKRH